MDALLRTLRMWVFLHADAVSPRSTCRAQVLRLRKEVVTARAEGRFGGDGAGSASALSLNGDGGRLQRASSAGPVRKKSGGSVASTSLGAADIRQDVENVGDAGKGPSKDCTEELAKVRTVALARVVPAACRSKSFDRFNCQLQHPSRLHFLLLPATSPASAAGVDTTPACLRP